MGSDIEIGSLGSEPIAVVQPVVANGNSDGNSDAGRMAAHDKEDAELNKPLLTFLLFTGIIDCADANAQSLIQNIYKMEKKWAEMLCLVVRIWFYLLRMMALCSPVWSIFRYSSYPHMGVCLHPSGSIFPCVYNFLTAGAIALYSLVTIYYTYGFREKVFENNFALSARASLLRKYLTKTKYYLVYAIASSIAFAIYCLTTPVWFEKGQQNLYYLLLLGQTGTCILASPALMFFLAKIEITIILMDEVNEDAKNDALSTAIYLGVEKLLRKQQMDDNFKDTLFLASNFLSVFCIFMTYIDRDEFSIIDTMLFGLHFTKEAVFIVVVIMAAARANTYVDDRTELLTQRLLLRHTVATSDSQIFQSLSSATASILNPLTNQETNRREGQKATSEEDGQDIIPSASEDNGTRVSTRTLSVSSDLRGRNESWESDLDALALCVAAVQRPLSYLLCGIRITQQRGNLALLSAGLSLAGLIFQSYYATTTNAT